MAIAARVQAATPAGRYRYADFLRVASILVVVFGHWLLLTVRQHGDQLEFGNVLVDIPWTRWLTWLLQVMPVFFLVGGYANAASLEAARRKGEHPVGWLRGRAMRLYWPVIPFLLLWTAIVAALAMLGSSPEFLKTLSQVVLVPAWFLAAYLAVVALSPWTYALHKRHGWTALGAMAALAVAVDVASRFGGVPFLGWSTYVFVWAAVHQVGYFWRDGRLPRTVPGRLALAAAGYAALATLVFVAGYPLGMVGANGAGVAETQTNTTPPSIALAALAIGQLGLLLAIEGPATRWLERPRAWAAVALVGSSIMTVYLWHMSAMVAVAAAVLPGAWWPKAASLDATYWALRPVWLLFLLAVLALLVLAFRRFERAPTPRAAGASVGAGLVAALGVVLTGAGMAATVLGGLHAPSMPLGIPLVPLGLVLAGLAALGVLRSQKTHAASDGAATTEGR